MDKQYSVQFFTSLVESIQKCCRDFLDFDQAVELSGYLNLEIDNFKKERYVLSEMISNTGDVISESYCTKAFKTVQRNPRRSPPPSPPRANSVLKDSSNHLDRNRAGGVGERGSPAPQAGKRHFGLSQRHHYLSPFHPGRRRNLIQSRRSVPSSFTQSSSFTRSSPSQSKDSQPYDIQARTSMAMTFSPSTEVVASLSQSFSVFGNDSLPSGAVKSDVSGLDDSDRSKEKTSGDLEALYVAATSVSDLEQSVFPSVSSNIYTSVTQTSAESVNTGTALETAASYTESAGSYAETVRLPVRIKEEEEENDDDDIMFIEGPTDISGTGGSTVNTSDSNVDISHPGMQSRLSSSLSDAQQHVGEDRSGGEDMKINETVADFNLDNDGQPYMTLTGSELPLTNRATRSTTTGSTAGVRMHQCTLCSYQTNQPGNLKRHQRRHSGDFYRCHLCTSYFYDRYQLFVHLKGHAGGLRCRVCDKSFTSKKGLMLHEKSHR
ncbi:Krueppel-like factor 12 isoform X7 [Gigantopelta aegis]|uniref:Krueppel-like factor 12 isoform X7 n=1 Tax=Gigantopelta aegis TaxID=1735272 RepID=UPI001B88CA29|nr:Krueppel-like factor 12 isoform X7 [Gigantopelta aegis]